MTLHRPDHAVLVPEAQAIGMTGVIRSLGRAGYRVHALSAQPEAQGLHSRFASVASVHPPYESADYLPWLAAYVERERIACIVPSEAFLVAIEPQFERYAALLPDAPAQRETLYRAFSKSDVEAVFAASPDPGVRRHLPRACVLRDGAPLDPTALAGWQWPLYLKTDARHDRAGQGDGSVRAVAALEALPAAVAEALRTHRAAQLQETVPGVKATVNLWRHRGEIRAESMVLALHENPHTGGLTAYRRLWWQQAMRNDAVHRLEALDWQGVAMVEYRFDADSDRFWFLELNARYWNALNVDLLAGKDFPRYQVDAFFGAPPHKDLGPGPLGLRARYTVPADVGYVMSRCRDPRVGLGAKLQALLGFFALGLNPWVKSDLWFAGDRALYWRAWRRFLGGLGRAA